MLAAIALLTILPLKPSGIAVVVNQQSDSVSLVDIAQYKVVAEIPVGGGPHESAVSPDGTRALVSNYFKQGVGPGASLSVIDIAAKKETKRIPLDKQAMPHDVRWVNGSQAVCTDERNERLLLIDIDQGKVLREYATGQRGSHMLSLNLDKNRLVCSNMQGGGVTIFDFKTAERIATISTGRECEGVGISPDGKTIWAGNRAEDTISILDLDTKQVVKKLDSKGFPYRVQFTPNGRFALFPHAQSGELVVCDVTKREIVRRIKIGASGTKLPINDPSPAGVWPLADNMFALVTVRNDNSLTMVDLTSGETLMRVVVGQSPDGVSMRPGRG